MGAALGLAGLITWQMVAGAEAEQKTAPDWRSEWAVAEGVALSIDTEGYDWPTSLAFVPEPGPGPKDPLYFVTELRGKVKVVTNDRTVYTFAQDFFQVEHEEELPAAEGESGLAGICLAPEQGFVFVTFAYQDAQGVLRNNIVRFESTPRTFSLEPAGQMAFTSLFDKYETTVSHQVGTCQVAGNDLFVSVGDGRQVAQSQEVDSLLGKILRLTLDGQPAPGNPLLKSNNAGEAASFVWAYGFRNPFGIEIVEDRLFVADNGSALDRFLEIQPGENYLWDGTDWSIGARADVTFSPNIGPAQVDYVPVGAAGLPAESGGGFFIAGSRPESPGVVRLGYRIENGVTPAMPDVPEYFVMYQGDNVQMVTGVALGPDGLYFVPILPDGGGRSAVLKAYANPTAPHPYLTVNTQDPESLMYLKGCFGCHQLGDEGGTAGPALDPDPLIDRLQTRLHSENYLQLVAEVDQLEREPFTNFAEARAAVLAAEGHERLRLWTIYHIMEPRFDNPNSLMPNLGLTEAQATLIADYLVRERTFRDRATAFAVNYLPEVPRPRDMLYSFGLGAVAGAGLMLLPLLAVLAARYRRGRAGRERP